MNRYLAKASGIQSLGYPPVKTSWF